MSHEEIAAAIDGGVAHNLLFECWYINIFKLETEHVTGTLAVRSTSAKLLC